MINEYGFDERIFAEVVENYLDSLGIDIKTLTPEEMKKHREWVDNNWDILMEDPDLFDSEDK